MVLEDKQRQLVLSCIAQAQLSSPGHAQIMFGHLVKGNSSVSATDCKPGWGNQRVEWHEPALHQARWSSAQAGLSVPMRTRVKTPGSAFGTSLLKFVQPFGFANRQNYSINLAVP